MALSVIEAEEAGNLQTIRKELTEAVDQQKLADKAAADKAQKPEGEVAAPVVTQPNIPDKFKGKTLEEVIGMYSNLESSHGRMANDLGQQRALTDRLLDLKRTEDLNTNTPAVEVTSQELLENPTQAIDKLIADRVKRQTSENQDRMSTLEATLAQEQFLKKHPDYVAFANDADFVKWVQASPHRVKDAQGAYNNDWNAADRLLTDYKELKALRSNTVQPTTTEVENQEKKGVDAARAAQLESGNNKQVDTSKGKIFKRVDIMALRLRDPEAYYNEDFQREIMKAYAEKRVK